MRASILNGMERAADIEKRNFDSLQHDTGGLPRPKLLDTNRFHLGILGGRAHFDRSRP